MKGIPLIVEELYFQWVHIPPASELTVEGGRVSEAQAERLYVFYEGLRLGVRLLEACQDP